MKGSRTKNRNHSKYRRRNKVKGSRNRIRNRSRNIYQRKRTKKRLMKGGLREDELNELLEDITLVKVKDLQDHPDKQVLVIEKGATAAATRIQSMQRGKLARKELAEQQEAATRIQAIQRGKNSRRAAEQAAEMQQAAEDLLKSTTTLQIPQSKRKIAALEFVFYAAEGYKDWNAAAESGISPTDDLQEIADNLPEDLKRRIAQEVGGHDVRAEKSVVIRWFAMAADLWKSLKDMEAAKKKELFDNLTNLLITRSPDWPTPLRSIAEIKTLLNLNSDSMSIKQFQSFVNFMATYAEGLSN